jgi:glycerol uptake facilitator protein/aquaporin Z
MRHRVERVRQSANHRREIPGGTPQQQSDIASKISWQLLARHSLLEMCLTTVLLIGTATIARWIIGPSPISRAVPSIDLRLVLIGVCVGLLLAALIQNPLGRASGGHMNPAISLAMWRFGVFPAAGVIAYTLAQLAGSLLGVIAGGALWGAAFKLPPVSYAALQPAHSVSSIELLAIEAADFAVLALAVGVCLSVARLTRWTPWVAGLILGGSIALLGPISGASINPARQFGPAVESGQTRFLWIYLAAPIVGALLAGLVRSGIPRLRPLLTHRLCGMLPGDELHGYRDATEPCPPSSSPVPGKSPSTRCPIAGPADGPGQVADEITTSRGRSDESHQANIGF